MTWFKVDDGFNSHPKVGLAGNKAIGLWVRAGSWSAQQLTDGFVPEHVIKSFGATLKDVENLVKVGLWITVEGGFQFHDWDHWQPSRADVEKRRADYRERQQRARAKKAEADS